MSKPKDSKKAGTPKRKGEKPAVAGLDPVISETVEHAAGSEKAPVEVQVKTGRPLKFNEAFIKQAEKLCLLGATDMELADFFEVDTRTIYRWKIEHAAFCHAIKTGKEAADDRVEKSLYNRAVGYTFESEKIVTVSVGNNQGSSVERVPIVEHVPPDTTAMIFWLKNRRAKEWRDRQEVEVTQVKTRVIRPAAPNGQ